jgi:hypothetical protein
MLVPTRASWLKPCRVHLETHRLAEPGDRLTSLSNSLCGKNSLHEPKVVYGRQLAKLKVLCWTTSLRRDAQHFKEHFAVVAVAALQSAQ